MSAERQFLIGTLIISCVLFSILFVINFIKNLIEDGKGPLLIIIALTLALSYPTGHWVAKKINK